MSAVAEAAARVAGPNTTPVHAHGALIAGRCATVEYRGSVVHAHGLALLVGDCYCGTDCWDDVADTERVELRVRLGSTWFTLKHVRAASYTNACPTHGAHR